MTLASQTYVSVSNGTDSSGCGGVNSPCATIQYALDSAFNDTVIIKAGIYRGSITIPDSTFISFISDSYLKGNPNDVTLTSMDNGVSTGTLVLPSGYTGAPSTDPWTQGIAFYGLNIDSVLPVTPNINWVNDDGNLLYAHYNKLVIEQCSITNQFPTGNRGFVSWPQDCTYISNSYMNVTIPGWQSIGSEKVRIFNSEAKNFMINLSNQNPNSANIDTALIVGCDLFKLHTNQNHTLSLNSLIDEFIPNNGPQFWTIINHCDIKELNPMSNNGSTQYKITNSIVRDIPNLTAYYNEFKNNIIPSGTSISSAINKSGNIFVNNINSLPSNNSNNPIFPGLGAGISTGLNTDKDGNPRPMPSGTNPDIGPYESVLSSPLICNLQASVAYEDSICSNSNTWAVLQSTSSIDSVYWSNASVNIDSALFPVGYHSVYLKDSLGCDTTIYFNVHSQQTIPPYDSYRPCYIYCDLDTGLNRVVMNTPSDLSGLYEWELLENVFGVWSVVSTKAVGDTTPWYHLNSNPYSKSYQYKIRLTDSCGLSYTQSDTVRTVLLQSSLGTNGEVNLSWNKYAGADIWYYVIYRKQGLAYYAIDSVGANNTSYIDNNAPAGNLTYYLGAVLQNPCSSSINKNGTLDNTRFFSNTVTQAVVGIEEQSRQIKISPNPTSGILEIDVPYSVDFEVINMNGQIVKEGKTEGVIDIGKLPAGTYTVIISTENRYSNHIVQKL